MSFKWWHHLHYRSISRQGNLNIANLMQTFENIFLQRHRILRYCTHSPWVCVIKVCLNGGATNTWVCVIKIYSSGYNNNVKLYNITIIVHYND